jgi:hypothetical protein
MMHYMPIDKDIFELAAAIIEAYGNEAIRQAAVHAHECESMNDLDGSETWDHVMHVIPELNRTWRRDGELFN